MVRISVDLPEEMAEALTRAAAELQSTREALLVEAARGYLADREDDGWAAFRANRAAFDAWIAEGEADIVAGRTVSFEEAMAEIDGIIAKARAAKA